MGYYVGHSRPDRHSSGVSYMKSKTAILVNQSSGYLTVDICNSFAEEYERVVLLAGKVSPMSRKLSDKVEVVKITPYDKSGLFKRFRSWMKGARDIDSYLESVTEPADILYFTNPPVSYQLADRRKGRFAVVEYDIYPDILRNVFVPEFIIRRLGRRKREILSKASGVVTLGDAMRNLLTAYCPKDKISVIHNWGGQESHMVRIPKTDNPFVKELGLEGKFVVMYSGNIGLTHNVESLLDVASLLTEEDSIRFLIIGSGVRKDKLKDLAARRGLNNVTFHDFLPEDRLQYSFSCADLGVVTLNEKTARSSVPSKTYNLLSYGIPLLNISPPQSELGNLINQFDCGASFIASDSEGIAEFIRKCARNPELIDKLRENAHKASESFSVENARLYTEIFK